MNTPSLLAAGAGHASTGEAAQFWVFAVIAVVGALCTVSLRQAVHSALSLAATMISLAIFYFAQGAVFLGIVQIVVYTGAVMMLFLFVVMLVGVSSADSLKETLRGQRTAAVCCGIGIGVLLIAGIAHASLDTYAGVGRANRGGNVQGLAALIFTRYVWAFEVTGALLITAVLGAMVLTHKERVTPRPGQAEQAAQRVREGNQVTPLPAPGVFARHNGVDIPALLPNGTLSELSVLPVIRERGQVREVSGETVHRLVELENFSDRQLGREPKLTHRTTLAVPVPSADEPPPELRAVPRPVEPSTRQRPPAQPSAPGEENPAGGTSPDEDGEEERT